jgi:anaerobic magnesium-protoporphyrin IX monomethyl ester cyclase
MKVLLMTPLQAFVRDPPRIPDLGLGYLATSLRQTGHSVLIRAWNPELTPEEFPALLRDEQPDVVGVKVFSKDVSAALRTLSVVRSVLPESILLVGGPHPSACESSELMREFGMADFAFRGEAETTLPQLLSLIEGKTRSDLVVLAGTIFENVSGLVWRTPPVVHANEAKLNPDIDSIGIPSWDLMDPRIYPATMLGNGNGGVLAPIITTRGCPGMCTYCGAHNVNGRQIRQRNPQNVFGEIKMLYDEYGVRRVMFMDNCFTSIGGNLAELCRIIIVSGMKIEWDCVSFETLANLTNANLALMRQAGCTTIHIGIESASERTRATINKRCELTDIAEKIRMIRKNGISAVGWFMIGFPNERLGAILETVLYAFHLDTELITFTSVFPLPGTAVYTQMKTRYGFRELRWGEYDEGLSPYAVGTLPAPVLLFVLRALRLGIRIRQRLRRGRLTPATKRSPRTFGGALLMTCPPSTLPCREG